MIVNVYSPEEAGVNLTCPPSPSRAYPFVSVLPEASVITTLTLSAPSLPRAIVNGTTTSAPSLATSPITGAATSDQSFLGTTGVFPPPTVSVTTTLKI